MMADTVKDVENDIAYDAAESFFYPYIILKSYGCDVDGNVLDTYIDNTDKFKSIEFNDPRIRLYEVQGGIYDYYHGGVEASISPLQLAIEKTLVYGIWVGYEYEFDLGGYGPLASTALDLDDNYGVQTYVMDVKDFDETIANYFGEKICTFEFTDGVTEFPLMLYNNHDVDYVSDNIFEGITTIGNYAFGQVFSGDWKHDNIKINICEGVETIDNYAFMDNNMIHHIDFPASLKTLGNSSFATCDLYDISIPETVETIHDYAFSPNSSYFGNIYRTINSLDIYCNADTFISPVAFDKLVVKESNFSHPNISDENYCPGGLIICPDTPNANGLYISNNNELCDIDLSHFAKGTNELTIPEGVTTIADIELFDKFFDYTIDYGNVIVLDYDKPATVYLPHTLEKLPEGTILHGNYVKWVYNGTKAEFINLMTNNNVTYYFYSIAQCTDGDLYT